MKKCQEGMCQGPEYCWLRQYLEHPAPQLPNHPELETDDVNAARRMVHCTIREELKQQYPNIFQLAEKPKNNL